MQLLAYFIYKCPSFVADLDFKVPMLTHQLVQKSSDSRSWFVLSRFRFQPFWKLVNQENDIRIPIDLWKVTDIHSNLFHHTGWYWYRLQVDFNFNFRSSCFWHSSQLLTYSLIKFVQTCHTQCFFLYVRPLHWSVQNFNTLVHVSDSLYLAFFVFNNWSLLIKQMAIIHFVAFCCSSKSRFRTIISAGIVEGYVLFLTYSSISSKSKCFLAFAMIQHMCVYLAQVTYGIIYPCFRVQIHLDLQWNDFF